MAEDSIQAFFETVTENFYLAVGEVKEEQKIKMKRKRRENRLSKIIIVKEIYKMFNDCISLLLTCCRKAK